MRYHIKTVVTLMFLLSPSLAAAQLFAPLNSLINTNDATASIPGTVDIVAEGETYRPSFYLGRAEPTTGNTVRLVAIPSGQPPQNFSYQWNVNGSGLAATGPVATFSDLFSNKVRVTVNVIDSTGALWARADATVMLSKPQVVFYEENVLRGHGSRAIIDTHTLIGEGGVIRAEPYFIGLQTNPTSYRAAWKVNSGPAESGGDWRELLLQRPQDPLANYKIEFTANSRDNLAEVISGRFNLNFGL